MHIIEVSLLKDDKTKDLQFGFDYPQPVEQAKFQNSAYSQVSRDLHSLELQQKQIYDNEQTSSLIIVKRVAKLDLSSDVDAQLKPKL